MQATPASETVVPQETNVLSTVATSEVLKPDASAEAVDATAEAVDATAEPVPVAVVRRRALSNMLASVSGKKRRRQRAWRVFLANARPSLKYFTDHILIAPNEATENMTTEEKVQLYVEYRRHVRHAARYNVHFYLTYMRYGLVAFFVSLIPLCVGVGYICNHLRDLSRAQYSAQNPSAPSYSFELPFLLGNLAGIVFWLFVFNTLTNALGRKLDPPRKPRRTLIRDFVLGKTFIINYVSSILSLFTGISLVLYPLRSEVAFATMNVFASGVGVVLAGAGWTLGFLAVFHLALDTVASLIQRTRDTFYPDSVVVDSLALLASRTEDQRHGWGRLRHRRALIQTLGTTAICIERYLPQMLRSQDLQTAQWYQTRSGEIGAAFRELIKWVLMPQRDTCEQLNKKAKQSLVFILRNEWDSLDRFTGEPYRIRIPLSTRIGVACRAIAIAALPGAGIMLLHLLNPRYEVPDFLTGGAALWAVLNLLAALDPTWQTRVSAFKDTVQVFPFGDKGKD